MNAYGFDFNSLVEATLKKVPDVLSIGNFFRRIFPHVVHPKDLRCVLEFRAVTKDCSAQKDHMPSVSVFSNSKKENRETSFRRLPVSFIWFNWRN